MNFSIDVMSDGITDLGVKFEDNTMIGGVAVAFDFNNAIDAVRVVGFDGANLFYFQYDLGDDRAHSVLRFTGTSYADGEVKAGTEPLIYANAYSTAISGAKAGSALQYAFDARTNALVGLADIAGELATIGSVMIDGAAADPVNAGGFHVAPGEGTVMAHAILRHDGSKTSGLYAINLDTAEATLMAELGMTGISGFAVSMGDMKFFLGPETGPGWPPQNIEGPSAILP